MSLYIQLTTRCNMDCNHCCFGCGEQGMDMRSTVFRQALKFAERRQIPVTLGGGEPTLHPRFMEFLWWSIRAMAGLTDDLGMPAVSLVTNGSRTQTALELAALAKVGVIWASVSRDEFHDPIVPQVFRAFASAEKAGDYRRISRPSFIVPAGRARHWGNHPFIKCACDGPFITPDGSLYSCGCRLYRFGHISQRPLDLPEEWDHLKCPNEQPCAPVSATTQT